MTFVLFSVALTLLGAALTYVGVTGRRRADFRYSARTVYAAATASFALAWVAGACYLRSGTALMLILAIAMVGLTVCPFAGVMLDLSRASRKPPR